jgi:hypothetical protein
MRMTLRRRSICAAPFFFFAGCAGPTDRSLAVGFTKHQGNLEELRRMFSADAQLQAVTRGFVRGGTITVKLPIEETEAVGLNRERYRRYVELLTNAELEQGLFRGKGDAIWFGASSPSLLNGGATKGYVYSTTPLEPLVPNLDVFRPPPNLVSRRPRFLAFATLREHWYLYKSTL